MLCFACIRHGDGVPGVPYNELVLCLGWNVLLIAEVGQWVTNKIFSVHFLTVSVSFGEEKICKKFNLTNFSGSVGDHQCYINWSSA